MVTSRKVCVSSGCRWWMGVAVVEVGVMVDDCLLLVSMQIIDDKLIKMNKDLEL